MDLEQKEILISEESKPFWQLILAAILFTSSIYVFYLVFHYLSIRWIQVGIKCLELALVIIMGALFFSVRRLLWLNIETKTVKIESRIGNIKIGFSEISDIEYISVFKNTKTENFEINLWNKRNKHLNITIFNDLNKAIECGKMFSNKLNIDLLDATEKGNSKWIDKTQL